MVSVPRRFDSVDALRGLTVAAMLLVNNPGDWSHVYAPLLHAHWHGCTPTDLIFPFFLFVVGVSIALGIVPRAKAGGGLRPLRGRIVWRALKILLLGLALHAVAMWCLDKPYFRPWGVLQRIGLCFLVVGLLASWWRPSHLGVLAVGILLADAALMAASGYAPLTNLASRVDTALLGPLAYEFDVATGLGHDPEGLLSTLPALSTTLFGVLAGDGLRRGRSAWLPVWGAVFLLLGWGWSHWVPLNKNLWTPSFVLWTAGWALLVLWTLHQLIDRLGLPPVGKAFGINAITVYAGSALMVYVLAGLGWWEPLYRVGLADWMTPRWGPRVPSLAFALAFVGLWWIVAKGMQKAGVIVKV
ncbi:MAG: heparan-alpha-glucosaminide N-acetyltransferase domain-containing protein [Pseudoxanthomonas sp.]